MADVKDDSKLSVAANITGIITFAVAVIGVVWLWFDAFAKAHTELEGVSKSQDSQVQEFILLNQSVSPEHRSEVDTTGLPKVGDLEIRLRPGLVALRNRRSNAMQMFQNIAFQFWTINKELPKVARQPIYMSLKDRWKELRSETLPQENAELGLRGGAESGMEILFAISLAANVLQLIGFAGQVLTVISWFYAGAAGRFLWVPFRAKTLETMRKMEELRIQKLFIQGAALDLRLSEIELRATVQEHLLSQVWEAVKEIRDVQNSIAAVATAGTTENTTEGSPAQQSQN